MYDLEVSGTHEYYANGILVHNCSYHSFLDHWGNHYGTEFYRKRSLFLKYWNRNLHIYPAAPSASVLRGDTRIFAAIDELGLFPMPSDRAKDDADETAERANAKEAVNSLESSLATVNKATRTLFNRGMDHVPTPILFGLSSPKHVKDMVMRRYRLTKTEEGKKIFLGSHLATWEVNPNLPRNDPFIVGKFTADPIGAMRDFGAQPPRTTATFVPPTHIIKERYPFIGPKNALKLEYEFSEEEVWGKLTNAFANKNKFPTIMAMDAGAVNNSFSIAAIGIDPEHDFKIRVPALVEVIPRDGLVINFNRMYKNVLLPFSKAMNCQVWLADRWGSIELLSRAKDEIKGLGVKQRSLRPADFESFLQVLWNTNLVLPQLALEDAREIRALEVDDYRPVFMNKPVHHLLHQFLTVQSGAGGSCPEKAEGLTDDNFRAVALGVWGITNPQILDIVKKEAVDYGSGPGARDLKDLIVYRPRQVGFR